MTQLNRDPLTGLLNREYLEGELPAVIESYIQRNSAFTVVMLDLDHFKTVNDVYGHARGDRVLKSFAHFLKTSTRSADKVIRFGGDEFLCIMPDCGRLNAEVIYDRVVEKCRKEEFDGLHLSISVGLASYPDDGNNYEKLFDAADASLYEAKRSGRDRIGKTQKKQISIPIKAFINRRDELNSFLQKINSDLDQPQFLVINGNVGVGKTRLVRESLNMTDNYEIIWSDCMLFSESIAYYVIRELTKYRIKRRGVEIFNELPMMYRLEMGKLVPEIVQDHRDEIDNMDLVLDRYRLYESVRKSIEIGTRPKAIVIDNFQWIDKESLDVLRYLIRSLKDSRILFILINRIEDTTGMVFDFLAETSREATVEEIDLRPLPVAEVRECVCAIIGDKPNDDLVKYAYQTVGGNPYYLEELFRALSAEKYLTLKNDQWQFQTPQNPLVPKSIEYIALTKYDRLSIESQQVLQFASIIGHFGIRALRFLTGFGDSELQGLLTYIKRAGVLRESQGKLIFVDEFSRQAIYKKHVKGRDARKLHLQVAQYLEADYSGKEIEVADELAHNYFLAQDRNKTVQYSLIAGQRAREKYANEDALRYYSWAEDVLIGHEGIEEQRFAILMAREQVYGLLGAREAQRQDLTSLEELAEALDDLTELIEIILRQARYFEEIDEYPSAIERAKKAIGMAQTLQNVSGEAKGYLLYGRNLWKQGNYEAARTRFDQALNLAQSASLRQIEAGILHNLGIVSAYLDDRTSSKSYWEREISICHEIGHRTGEGRGLMNLSLLSMRQGEYMASIFYIKQSLNILREIGDRYNEGYSLTIYGLLFIILGDYDQSKLYLKQCLRICSEIGFRRAEGTALVYSSLLYQRLSDYKTAQSLCSRALLIAQETGNRDLQGRALNNLGYCLTMLGHLEEAIDTFQQAISIKREIGQTSFAIEPLAGLASASLAQGNLTQAQTHIDEILDYLENNTLDGTDEPFRVHLTCYHVLKANQDPRVHSILEAAHCHLQVQAAKISDADIRRSFLENVATHKEIVDEYAKIYKNSDQ